MSVAALWAFGLEMQNMFHLLLETNPRAGFAKNYLLVVSGDMPGENRAPTLSCQHQ